jgi:hypothetical protein
MSIDASPDRVSGSAPETFVPGQTALIRRTTSALSGVTLAGRSRPSAVMTILTCSEPAML